MNNNLHKLNKGELHMYAFIAILYRFALIICAIIIINFLINL